MPNLNDEPRKRRSRAVSIGLALVAAGTMAGCVRYAAAPLAPADSLRRFGSRSLADPGVLAAVARALGRPGRGSAPDAWDLPALTAAALWLNPDLAVARRQVETARAAVVTAGQRPNPTATFNLENAFPAGPSPWILGLALDVTVETAGKRAARLSEAGALVRAADFAAADAAWNVRSGVRAALVGTVVADRDAALAAREAALRRGLTALYAARTAAGELSQPELDLARAEAARAEMAAAAAAGRREEARAALAEAVGVPAAALSGVPLVMATLDPPPRAAELTPEAAQTAALLNRADLAVLLASYDAAEGALRGEVAKQYPDLHLNPGYLWNQAVHQFAFGFAAALPVLNRNRGPVAQALARRAEAEARFLAAQASAVGRTAQALAAYRAAQGVLAAAEASLREIAGRRERLARLARDLGEADQVTVADAELAAVAQERARLEAVRQAQTALGRLEDSLQRPVAEEDFLTANPP